MPWNLCSGDILGNKASVSGIEVSPEWNMSWGLLIINQQIKYNFPYILPWNLLKTLF